MNQKFTAFSFAAALLVSSTTFGAVVYDNTELSGSVDLGQYYSSTNEFGDQVNLAGTDRTITDFSFYGFLNASTLSGQSYVFRFYDNTGATPAGSPGALLFQSDPQPLGLGFRTYSVSGLSVTVPNSFTWTVQFSGLGAGEDAGLQIWNPPGIGSSLNDFWEEIGGSAWSLLQLNGGATPANFGARFTAVPEPGVFALGALGALVWASLRSRKNSRN